MKIIKVLKSIELDSLEFIYCVIFFSKQPLYINQEWLLQRTLTTFLNYKPIYQTLFHFRRHLKVKYNDIDFIAMWLLFEIIYSLIFLMKTV